MLIFFWGVVLIDLFFVRRSRSRCDDSDGDKNDNGDDDEKMRLMMRMMNVLNLWVDRYCCCEGKGVGWFK